MKAGVRQHLQNTTLVTSALLATNIMGVLFLHKLTAVLSVIRETTIVQDVKAQGVTIYSGCRLSPGTTTVFHQQPIQLHPTVAAIVLNQGDPD